jgi:hypothetical protein
MICKYDKCLYLCEECHFGSHLSVFLGSLSLNIIYGDISSNTTYYCFPTSIYFKLHVSVSL